MNSIERVLAALTFGKAAHGPPDRVPVLPVPLMQGALVCDCTVAEYFAMPAGRIAEAQTRINEMFDGIPDGVAGFPHVIEDVTAFGVELVQHYPNSTPAIEGMRITDFEQIDGLKCPSPKSSPTLRKTLEIIAQLAGGIGEEKLVIGAAIAPFSLPSMLMGTSKWMRLLFTPALRNRYFERIMDTCQRFVVDWATLQLQAGAHVVVLADGMASATMLPRNTFQEFAFPVIRNTIEQIQGMVAYEAVGRIEPHVDLCANIGAVGLLIGQEDDIANCKKKLNGRAGLIGNVNNLKMRRWSPARIEMQAKTALKAGAPGFGFALANQGPEIPFDTSLDGIGALIRAVEKYGRYDRNGDADSAAPPPRHQTVGC